MTLPETIAEDLRRRGVHEAWIRTLLWKPGVDGNICPVCRERFYPKDRRKINCSTKCRGWRREEARRMRESGEKMSVIATVLGYRGKGAASLAARSGRSKSG